MIASPDEVAAALTDCATRQLWDPSLKSIEKAGSDASTFRVSYFQSSGGEQQGQVVTETVKYSLVRESVGNYFIQEQVNGNTYRYFEIQQVQNRPYFLRVIYHA